jgi:hypothetical protein
MSLSARSAETNAPITCVVSLPHNCVVYRPMTPVFCFEPPRGSNSVYNHCHHEEMEEWLKNATKSALLEDEHKQRRSTKPTGSGRLQDVGHRFMLRYTFIGVTVAVLEPVGSRRMALDVGNHLKVCNSWGSAAEPSGQLGIRLSLVTRGDGVDDLTLSWATRRNDGTSDVTDKKQRTHVVLSWFLPLFICLTVQGGLVTATPTLQRTKFELDKY